MDKVWAKEEPPHAGVTAVKFNQKQVDPFCLIPWLLAEVDLHLVVVVWCGLELPWGNGECLKSSQISEHQLRLTEHERKWESDRVEERQELHA